MQESLIDFLNRFHPVVQALFATMFTWFVTAAGASPVFFAKKINQKFMDGMLGLAAGVMIAASFWSLLNPAIEMSGGSVTIRRSAAITYSPPRNPSQRSTRHPLCPITPVLAAQTQVSAALSDGSDPAQRSAHHPLSIHPLSIHPLSVHPLSVHPLTIR